MGLPECVPLFEIQPLSRRRELTDTEGMVSDQPTQRVP
jgi:hypothetical protein